MNPKDILGREIKIGDWVAYAVSQSNCISMSIMHICDIKESTDYSGRHKFSVKGNLFKPDWEWIRAEEDRTSGYRYFWTFRGSKTFFSPERSVLLNANDPVLDLWKFQIDALEETERKEEKKATRSCLI